VGLAAFWNADVSDVLWILSITVVPLLSIMAKSPLAPVRCAPVCEILLINNVLVDAVIIIADPEDVDFSVVVSVIVSIVRLLDAALYMNPAP